MGRDSGSFVIKYLIMPHRHDGLHLYDSTFSINLRLLLSAILWQIWELTSRKYASVGGGGAESNSFDEESFGNFSEVEYHVRDHDRIIRPN